MKKVYSFLLFVLLSQMMPAQKSAAEYKEAFDLIEVWLQAEKDFEELPAITAAVVDDQETIWKGSFGKANIEGNVEAEPSTLFSICSISKLFTSVAIMKLYDEGKLRLDDEIQDVLPWFDMPQKYKDSGPITIENLLTHSSGLPREANAPYWTGPDFPFPEKKVINEGLSEQETLYPSSTYFQYSNLGLTLLGEIVEEVSGMPYGQYVQRNILTPLRLQDTRTELPKDLYGKKLAIGYSAEKRQGDREKINFFDAKGIKPAAGYSSNVEDLARFAQWQFRLLDTSQTEILKPATLRNMHNVHWTDPDFETTWGLGFSVYKGPDGKKWVSHGGSCPGYRTVLQLNPAEKRAYVVMINAGGTSPEKFASGINDLLNKYKAEEKFKPEEDANFPLTEYKGYYNPQPWSSEVYVAPWKGKLAIVNFPSDNPGAYMNLYKPVSKDTFKRIRDNGEPGETLTFQRDKSGKIVSFQSHGNYTKKINR